MSVLIKNGTMDMPFGGTTSADDFESGTIAAAFGWGAGVLGCWHKRRT